ncbi:hypothetical protein [Autumnicola edwardsiae]|uniref:DUF4198 domain-containing protein n=1 Tax=Autumnicola edwardsiae TaxID=3075594 RepID=A0ABU3CUS2_9FLAO|nr:hypothetical protein [Zunongwangia sp. F297]MDT0650115.1 hypothetical protein [Zunongwangia sp. F297]
MKDMKTLQLFTILFLAVASVQAHALYIDTNPEGVRGKRHEVKVYYSEFTDGTVENVADWYSDVVNFHLYLVQPNGNRITINTTAHRDHYSASFVPEREGPYRLQISHMAEDPGDGTAYQFNAFAQVIVGESVQSFSLTETAPDLVLIEKAQEIKDSDKRIFRTFFKGVAKGGITATIFLPSGETREIVSNSEGILEVELPEKGIYFLEATTYHEEESGHTRKAAYKATWRCATWKIEKS